VTEYSGISLQGKKRNKVIEYQMITFKRKIRQLLSTSPTSRREYSLDAEMKCLMSSRSVPKARRTLCVQKRKCKYKLTYHVNGHVP
jgi:hypothetical protein